MGEKGTGFSEGQSQRLSIARALLRRSPILILDEATSALDVYTERLVLKNIMDMGYARTCIVTTHRPSVLNLCDRVYKIDKSSVSEIDHQEVEQLIKRFLKRDNMKETYEDFLQLLKASINKSEVKINNVNWQSILQLSNIHKVLPLVYEALYKSEEFKNTDKDFQKYFKTTSMQIIYNQIQRSERFFTNIRRI